MKRELCFITLLQCVLLEMQYVKSSANTPRRVPVNNLITIATAAATTFADNANEEMNSGEGNFLELSSEKKPGKNSDGDDNAISLNNNYDPAEQPNDGAGKQTPEMIDTGEKVVEIKKKIAKLMHIFKGNECSPGNGRNCTTKCSNRTPSSANENDCIASITTGRSVTKAKIKSPIHLLEMARNKAVQSQRALRADTTEVLDDDADSKTTTSTTREPLKDVADARRGSLAFLDGRLRFLRETRSAESDEERDNTDLRIRKNEAFDSNIDAMRKKLPIVTRAYEFNNSFAIRPIKAHARETLQNSAPTHEKNNTVASLFADNFSTGGKTYLTISTTSPKSNEFGENKLEDFATIKTTYFRSLNEDENTTVELLRPSTYSSARSDEISPEFAATTEFSETENVTIHTKVTTKRINRFEKSSAAPHNNVCALRFIFLLLMWCTRKINTCG